MTEQAERKLRILMCITPRHFSGAERVIVNLAGGLHNRGHHVEVITKPQERLVGELLRHSVQVRTAPIGGKLNFHTVGLIVEAAREMEADLIYTALSTASLQGGKAARRLRLPVVSHVQALNTAWVYRRATRLITCSKGVKAHLVSQRVPPEKIDVIYNGIDEAMMQGLEPAADVRAALGIAPHAPVVTIVAHLHPKKGHRYLIEAVGKLAGTYPGMRLLCLGQNSGQLMRLERLADKLKISEHVQFLGFRLDAMSIIAASDVVVLPSVAMEGLGMVLTEAAYLGKPTIGTQLPGIEEALVDGTTGYLVPPADAQALTARLDELLSNAELRRTMGEAGRVWVTEQFSLSRQLELTEATFARAIEEYSGGQGG